MRILLTGGGHPSHLLALIAMGDELKRQGHDVVWWSRAKEQYIEFEQIDTRTAAPEEYETLLRISARHRAYSEAHRGTERDPVVQMGTRRVALGNLDDEKQVFKAILRASRPDVVAVDGTLFARMLACYEANVPFAAVSPGLQCLVPSDFVFPDQQVEADLVRDRNEAIRARGHEPEFREWYCVSPHCNLVFATEALVRMIPGRPANTHLVGPCVLTDQRKNEAAWMRFPLDRLSADKPILYASFGTIHQDVALMRAIAVAAARNRAQLVVTAGDSLDALRDLEGDVIVNQYVPQLDVLRRASGFVTHGGAGSLMEAMYFGVPVLMLPLCTDQPFNAWVVEQLGADAPGLVLAPEAATVDALTESIRALLHGNVRRNAQRIARDYQARDGGKEGAQLLLSLGARGAPDPHVPWRPSP